ncbi:MAG TPA: response regulator [Campylobacterales bacterium]|nr:response regulator [Campylobacterales bacterium]
MIILDVNMPVMGGLELLEKLKKDEKLKYIPVIMVTAEDEERHRALELGSEDFLLKPIDM